MESKTSSDIMPAPPTRTRRARARPAVATREFSFGIEEEYFLAHASTMAVATDTPEQLFKEVSKRTGGRAGHESLQAQIEVSTVPHLMAALAREQLASLRAAAAQSASKYGLAILASGTHPSAEWTQISHTVSERYDGVMDALQMVGRRNMLCGMHVHVELPDPSRRVDVMGRMIPFLPLLLAMSTSSPFWRSQNTGLKGYRLAAYDELPRTGIPELFASETEYEDYVAALVVAGVMEDASHVWWALRPSLKYPTLELRAPDCCTRIEDAVAIACLFRVLARFLYRNLSKPATVTHLMRALAVENKWRAQRFGVQGSFAAEAGPMSVREMLESVIAMTAEDAEALGCQKEVTACLNIVERGTSADAQLKVFQARSGESADSAVNAVAKWIAETTLHKC